MVVPTPMRLSPGDLDGVVHRRARADALVVEVAATRHRRDRVHGRVRRRREAHAAHVHVDGHARLEDVVHVLDVGRLRPAHVGDGGRGRRGSMNVVGHAGAGILDVVALDALGVGQ